MPPLSQAVRLCQLCDICNLSPELRKKSRDQPSPRSGCAGSATRRPEGDNWSALERAVHNNRIDIARLLIQRGANVNYVDRFGYTPLLLAASIDFGDSEMIDLLLKSDARPDAHNKA